MSDFKTEPEVPGHRFALGAVRITEAASAALEKANVEGVPLLFRHLCGDWGDGGRRDALQNELAVLLDLRIVSSYSITKDATIWIITEADRSTTTVMLPDGYQKMETG